MGRTTRVVALIAVHAVLATGSLIAVAAPREASDAADYGIVASGSGTRFGETPASFSVRPGGTAAYVVPIWTPPGRGGVQPRLSLSYDSGGGNSTLGVGWSLVGGSEIRRCARTLAQEGENSPVRFDDTDAFCLDGRRLLPVSGRSGEFRIEHDPATRVTVAMDTHGPNHFEVRRSDGTIATYGADGDERAPGAAARLEGERVHVAIPVHSSTDRTVETRTKVRHAWALWQVRDRPGNYLRWAYRLHAERGQTGDTFYELLPVAVEWTGFLGSTPTSGVSTAPNRRIDFIHEERPDVYHRYVAGFGLLSKHRLAGIRVSGPGLHGPLDDLEQPTELLRSYSLRYDTPSVSRRSLLQSVEECGADGGCREPIRFDWELGCGLGTAVAPTRVGTGCSTYFSPDASEYENVEIALPDVMRFGGSRDIIGSMVRSNLPQVADLWTLQLADLDRDGRDDLLYRVPQNSRDQTEIRDVTWRYRLGTGRGFGPPVDAGLPNSLTGAPVEQLRLADLDGDGDVEAVSVVNADPDLGTDGAYEVFTFDGSRFRAAGLASSETFKGWWLADEPTLFPAMHVGDLNGDGRPELVRSAVVVDPTNPDPTPRPYRWAYRANSSDGNSITMAPYRAVGITSGIDHESYLVDTDNDGDVELLARASGNGADGFAAQMSAVELSSTGGASIRPTALSGLPFEVSNQLNPNAALGWPRYTYFRQWFADINGDGLKDAVAVRSKERINFPDTSIVSTMRGMPLVSINTGNGFKAYRPWGSTMAIANIHATTDPYTGRAVDNGLRVVDHDFDGREDLLLTDDGGRLGGGRLTRPSLLRSDGQGDFTASSLAGVPIGRTTFIHTLGNSRDHGWGRRMTQVGDLNADGLADLVQATDTGLRVSLRKGLRPDLLVGVHARRSSPQIKISYAPLTAPGVHTPGRCSYPVRCAVAGPWVVSRTVVDEAARERSRAYSYAGGAVDLRGHGWLGFTGVTVVDELTGARWTRSFDSTVPLPIDTAKGTYSYPFRHHAKSETREVAVGARSDRRRETTLDVTWKVARDASGTTPFVYPAQAKEVESEGATTLTVLRAVTRTVTVDGFGRTRHRTERRPAAPQNPAGDEHTDELDVTYSDDLGNWLLGGPQDVEQRSTTPDGRTSTRRIHYGYDQKTGQLLHAETAPQHAYDEATATSNDLWRERTLVRDAYGLVTRVEDVDARQFRETSIEYDTLDHTFPRSVTRDLDHVERFQYHAGLGRIAVAEDVNGLRTVYRYDGLGRIRVLDRPGDDDVTVLYTQGYTAESYPGDAVEVRLALPDKVNPFQRHRVVLDQQGRPAREYRPGFNGVPSIVDHVYDRAGNLARESVPFANGAAPAGWHEFGHDNLGRITSAARPGALPQTYVYDGATTRTTDESGAVRLLTWDGRSRLIRTADIAPDGHEIATTYAYGPFDVLEKVTDHAGNVTTVDVDELGRVTGTTDPDSGHRTAAFNGLGNPKWTENSAGERTTYQFDALNRVYAYTDAQETTYNIWESGPKRGRLQSVVPLDTRPRKAYEYDTLGRRSAEHWATGGGEWFGVRRYHDSFGRLERLSYHLPGSVGPDVVYSYNKAGFLEAIHHRTRGAALGSPGELLWRADRRDAAGRLTRETFGNGLVGTRTYDAAGNLRRMHVQPKTWLRSAPPVQDLRYEYDPRGHVRRLENAVTGAVQTFVHDHLGRLTTWTVTQAGATTEWAYTYDDLGNLLTRGSPQHPAESTVYHYADPARPHTVTSSETGGQTTSYQHDAAGRQVTGHARTVTYTPFDAPARIELPGETVRFTYDGSRERIRSTSSTGAVETTVGGLLERRTAPGMAPIDIFTVPGPDGDDIAQIVRTGSGAHATERTQYLHRERIGGTDVVSDASGAEIERFGYEPFGGRRDVAHVAGPNPHPYSDVLRGFGGHRAFPQVPVLETGGRTYDPESSRFLSPDPLLPSVENGQLFNRFSYGMNSPLSQADPTGFRPEGISEQADAGKTLFSFDLYDVVRWLQDSFAGAGESEAAGEAALADPGEPASVADTADKQGSRSSPAIGGEPGTGGPALGTTQSDRVTLLGYEDQLRREAFSTLHQEYVLNAANPFTWAPMFAPGQGTTPGLDWGLAMDIALTTNDLNDWLGPSFRYSKAMDEVGPQARARLLAHRENEVRAAQYRLMTETLNSLGFFWMWQNDRSAPPAMDTRDQLRELTKVLNSKGIYWWIQEGPVQPAP